MSDRASNEKKADRLLDIWRNELPGQCNEHETHQVEHFHWMAHVLLGFHRYVCKDIKDLESGIVSDIGPIGRDELSVFMFWKTKGTVVERLLKTVSDVFGPSSDHHGLCETWEAHCATTGTKLLIGNYKDNRFNALFQTAVEIFLHRSNFKDILEFVI